MTLGRSGVKVTRLAFGTGTISGQVQRSLGQDGFTRLVRHAYDSGIRFFETSESYGEMHTMLGIALKGIPRDSYQLMSKVTTRDGVDPQQKLDELRRLANTEYFDIMLLHWQHTATWPADTARWQDGILDAQSRKVVRTHGASVHGLPALRPGGHREAARRARRTDGRRRLRHLHDPRRRVHGRQGRPRRLHRHDLPPRARLNSATTATGQPPL